MSLIRWLYASLLLITPELVASAPTANSVRFLGRVNPKTSELTWPGTGLSFDFTGTQATINFASISGSNSLLLAIDKQTPTVIPSVNSNQVKTPVLASGRHTVTLIKRSEANLGTLFFGNVTATGGSVSANAAPSRRIEFIGDSITVGYGEDGTLPCTNTATVEDAPETYGAMTARNFSADYSLVAWSGKGVTRNYVTATPDTSPKQPELWTRYGANDADNSYTFPAASTPQAVVINLGTNDYSYMLYYANGTEYDGRPLLNDTVFAQTYLTFARQVVAKYPKAHLFLVTSPMLGDGYPAGQMQHTNQLKNLQYVATQLNNPLVQVVDFPTEVQGQGLTGCDYHPGMYGHQQMADILIPAMKKALGW